MRLLSFLTCLILIGIIGFLSLEFLFRLTPCKLCNFQRIPFYIGLAICIAGLLLPKIKKYVIFGIAILFIFNAGLAAFHFFVEEGLFIYECISGFEGTIEELKISIYSTPSCSVKSYFLGVRVSILSFLYSLFIATISIIFSLKRRGI